MINRYNKYSLKVIFIGDKFQLPPVNETISPALNPDFLNKQFGLRGEEYELTKVMRQDENSEIFEESMTEQNLTEQNFKESENLRTQLDEEDLQLIDEVLKQQTLNTDDQHC